MAAATVHRKPDALAAEKLSTREMKRYPPTRTVAIVWSADLAMPNAECAKARSNNACVWTESFAPSELRAFITGTQGSAKPPPWATLGWVPPATLSRSECGRVYNRFAVEKHARVDPR